jgi:two-component system, chemotaxis family, sensor kinase CheA
VAASVTIPEALLARFRAVAFERLERVESTWTGLTRGTATPNAEEELFRELHTLKGDARVVGFADVAVLCQRLEDLLSAARHHRYRVHEDVDIVVTMAIQFAGMLLRKKGAVARGSIDLDGFLAQIEQVLSEWLRRSSEAPDLSVQLRPHVRPDAAQRMSAAARSRLAVVATTVYLEHLRVPARSRQRLREVWDVLSREIAELESSPMAPLLARHAAAGIDLARGIGKAVEIVSEADDVHLSAEAFDAVSTAVLHAVRNAIDHGVESILDRARVGKPAVGTISVRARQRDDLVEIDVSDDGGGIDFDAVRRKAASSGLASSDLASASDAELAEMLFSPGFTTRESVTEVSGRGVGLDAARVAVARLGGDVRIESRRGAGSTVHIKVPNRRALVDVHLFRAPGGDASFAVEAQWTEESGSDPRVTVHDPLDALEIPRNAAMGTARVLRLTRDGKHRAFSTDGLLRRGTAARLCPTPDEMPAEIVRVGDEEAVLLRPDTFRDAVSDA